MDPYITEWLNLAVRWMHMITGVAWIGASFYFVWLENNLNRENPKEDYPAICGPFTAAGFTT